MSVRIAAATALLAGSVGVAGCGRDQLPAASPSARASAHGSTAPPIPAPTPPPASPSAPAQALLNVGQTFRGETMDVTVHSAKVGGPADEEPDPGEEWLHTDVKVCNTSSEPVGTPGFGSWFLRSRDDHELAPADITPEPREPALPYGRSVLPGDCLRGWLTFALPERSAMAEIRLVDDFPFGPAEVLARWR